MEPIQNTPVNFFMGGGRYISDNFNMQLLDTSNPNCFENINLTSIKPDMMSNYINSEKLPEEIPKENSGGFFTSLLGVFSSQKSESIK